MGKIASFLLIAAVALYAVWPWIRRFQGLSGAPQRRVDTTLLESRAYGYQLDEVRAYLVALGAEGRRWYVRQRLLRGALFGLAGGFVMAGVALGLGRALAEDGYSALSWLAAIAALLWLAVTAAVLVEGWLIRALLLSWPLIEERSVHRASSATRAKFAMFFVAGLPTFGLGVMAFAAWLKSG